jgi:CubicO group peptidase (beta-lactamase class C family)
LLAQAIESGELRLDDPVANCITELQQGHDIRRVTFGQLASHTSGLPRVPQNYEPWHRGKYTLPDFIRFLKAWRADAIRTFNLSDITALAPGTRCAA